MESFYAKSKEFTDKKIGELRGALDGVVPESSIVVACGSYARREASEESDIDFFVISNAEKKEDIDEGLEKEVREAVLKIVPKSPAVGGAFNKHIRNIDLLENIGGPDDTNETITRRMLFLLEGEWLANGDGFKSLRRTIIEKYIYDKLADRQLALFLLNDIIRYWRTITVDYSEKITGDGAKPWAVRNIKLIFFAKNALC